MAFVWLAPLAVVLSIPYFWALAVQDGRRRRRISPLRVFARIVAGTAANVFIVLLTSAYWCIDAPD